VLDFDLFGEATGELVGLFERIPEKIVGKAV
jgi:hypothetical protein